MVFFYIRKKTYLCSMKANDIFDIFARQVAEYHKIDSVDVPIANPYAEGSFEHLLWEKNYVDTVQWHLEDLIRPEDVDPVEALRLKRWIDRSNQRRTDMVERIDDHYMQEFAKVTLHPDAKINTETPAWALDRLSILALKISIPIFTLCWSVLRINGIIRRTANWSSSFIILMKCRMRNHL